MTFVKTILDTHIPVEPGGAQRAPKYILDVFRKLRQQWQEHAQVINGNLEFGNPTSGPVNINGVWQTAVTPSTPNTDFVITHNLGRVPANYNPTMKSAACDVYESPTANPNPETQIILRATAASVNLTFFMY
jgi:hypothetical protein